MHNTFLVSDFPHSVDIWDVDSLLAKVNICSPKASVYFFFFYPFPITEVDELLMPALTICSIIHTYTHIHTHTHTHTHIHTCTHIYMLTWYKHTRSHISYNTGMILNFLFSWMHIIRLPYLRSPIPWQFWLLGNSKQTHSYTHMCTHTRIEFTCIYTHTHTLQHSYHGLRCWWHWSFHHPSPHLSYHLGLLCHRLCQRWALSSICQDLCWTSLQCLSKKDTCTYGFCKFHPFPITCLSGTINAALATSSVIHMYVHTHM